MMNDKEKIKIENIEEVFDIVKKDELKKIYDLFVKQFDEKFVFSGVFDSKKEIVQEVYERISDKLKSEYHDIKNKISFLRKKGEDVNHIDYNLLSFDSKLRVFNVYCGVEDYLVVANIILGAKDKLKNFEFE